MATLPLDILKTIFGYVPHKDLVWLNMVCSEWDYALKSHERLWKRVVINLWTEKFSKLKDENETWRAFYLHHKNNIREFYYDSLKSRMIFRFHASKTLQEVTDKVRTMLATKTELKIEIRKTIVKDWTLVSLWLFISKFAERGRSNEKQIKMLRKKFGSNNIFRWQVISRRFHKCNPL